MQIQSTTSNPKGNGFYVLFYNQPQDILNHLQEITHVDDYLSRIIEKFKNEPKLGDYLLLPLIDSALGEFLVLCYSDGKQKTLLNLAGKIPEIISKSTIPRVIIDTTLLTERPDNFKKMILSSINDKSYQFDTFQRDNQPEHIRINWRCSLDEQKTVDDELERINALNQGVNLARDLGNMPANICTPSYLAEQATKMAKTHADLTVEIIEEDEMKQLGMGALLAVAQGSRQASKLIVIKYQPAQLDQVHPIVLVGKGVTFDAGGISLKPAAAMDLMKYDMGGAASVFGAIKAAAIAQINVPIIGIIPAVENLPDGNAVKPGDVVRSLSGRTIEILNTDAEGRLILCDALTYAEQFKPQVVIDIATLTGACVIALGSPRAGLMGNDEALIDALYQAGEKSGDKVWHLPLDAEYAEMLKSSFADVANISSNKEAGAITAAAFLSLFTEEMRWCHLDIAGVAWKSGGADKGSTGRPVSLLFEFLCQQDA